MDDCNDAEKHPLCTPVQKQEKVTLPTRVVAVGPADGSKLPKLVETHGEEGSYIALSHCWGKTQIITTTKATIASRKESIEWSLLSQTFQDAITWTRRLGIPYIWIDSLCIVQDDLQDWATESTKMGTIYEHAHLTLAATAAPSGTLGFRSPRTPPQSFHLRDTPHRVSAQLQPSHDSFTRRSQADPRLMPLLSRAWVYQERLLSARELVFECQNGYACECGGISRYSGLTSHNTSVKQEYRDALLGARDAAYTWEAVVRAVVRAGSAAGAVGDGAAAGGIAGGVSCRVVGADVARCAVLEGRRVRVRASGGGAADGRGVEAGEAVGGAGCAAELVVGGGGGGGGEFVLPLVHQQGEGGGCAYEAAASRSLRVCCGRADYGRWTCCPCWCRGHRDGYWRRETGALYALKGWTQARVLSRC